MAPVKRMTTLGRHVLSRTTDMSSHCVQAILRGYLPIILPVPPVAKDSLVKLVQRGGSKSLNFKPSLNSDLRQIFSK